MIDQSNDQQDETACCTYDYFGPAEILVAAQSEQDWWFYVMNWVDGGSHRQYTLPDLLFLVRLMGLLASNGYLRLQHYPIYLFLLLMMGMGE